MGIMEKKMEAKGLYRDDGDCVHGVSCGGSSEVTSQSFWVFLLGF